MRLSMRLGFIVAALAYLLGSIPFGYILARVFLGTDVAPMESEILGLQCDAHGIKEACDRHPGARCSQGLSGGGHGDCPGERGRIRPPAHPVYLLAGLAAIFAILGHVFPVWLRFKGGKGVATGVGVFFALAPKAILIVLGIFALILAGSRYVSLASIIASAAFPLIAYALADRERARALLPFMCAASLLIIAKHHQNIRRLLSGSEHRFGSKKK